jgi:pimeloyl-ACP methyl ester carboxylesterase
VGFAQHASTREWAILAAVQRPLSLSCTNVAVGRPLWKDRPTFYLIAEDDRMIVRETQRFMADRMKARVQSAQLDHAPMVSAPDAVVNVIQEAMRAVASK